MDGKDLPCKNKVDTLTREIDLAISTTWSGFAGPERVLPMVSGCGTAYRIIQVSFVVAVVMQEAQLKLG